MLKFTVARTTSPSGLAVSLAEAKAHLRVSGSHQDELLTLLIESATERLERDIERTMLTSSWVQKMEKFPCKGAAIHLNLAPVTAVTSLTYEDTSGVLQTLDAADYEYDAGSGSVLCKLDDTGWPEVYQTQTQRWKVNISFTAGIADADCLPRLYKQAILLEVGRAYFDPAQENGVNTNDGKSYEMIVRKLIRSSYP